MRAILMWNLPLLITFCSVGVARPEEDKIIDPSWLVKARTEVKAAYDKFVALSSRLEEESEERHDKVPGSTGTMPFRASTIRVRVVRLNDEIICEQVRIFDNAPKKTQIRLECDNSDYHFSLNKSSEDAPYALTEYGLGKRKISLIQQEPGMHNDTFSYFPYILAAIDNESEYTLKRLQFDKSKRLLSVEFAFSAGNDLRENYFYFDPDHSWRLVERKVEDWTGATVERWSYGIMVGGLEFPTECKNLTTYKVAKAPPNLEIAGRLLSLKITDKTREAFRLSAFGLPEPIDAPPLPKTTPWYLWIMAASAICAVIAIGFAYLRRRSQRAAV